MSFGKWRGLSEGHLHVIRQELEDRMASLLGTQMLFDLITVREYSVSNYLHTYVLIVCIVSVYVCVSVCVHVCDCMPAEFHI